MKVHYVTARTEVSREGTDRFIMDHKLPGWQNLHFCPHWQGSKRHKTEAHARLAREHRVIASIGDTHEEEGEAATGRYRLHPGRSRQPRTRMGSTRGIDCQRKGIR